MKTSKKYLRRGSHKTNRIKRGVKAIDRIKQTREGLLDMLDKVLNSLPENDSITPINNTCFTIKYSSLSTESWDPKFHCFKHQYKAIAEYLRKAKVGKIESTIKKIIKDKQITSTFSFGKETIKIHPKVITLLKEWV